MQVHERAGRNKAIFWAFLLAFLGLAAIPSFVLVETLEGYFQFLSGWDPGVLKAVQVRFVPHRGGVPHAEIQVHFVEFRLKAPKAKTVSLAADFNQWKPETLPLRRGARGVWETIVPLPAGRYQYLFLVDGAWTPDPDGADVGRRGDLKTSLRQVP